MDLSEAPAFLSAKMAQLADARAAAATRADELIAQISFVRDRLNGRVLREGDDPEKLRIEFDRLLAEQKAIHARRPIETDTIDRCKAWLAALAPATVLEQVAPVVEDGLSLAAVRIGAKAVGVGRYYPYPLAAAGQAGVERALGLMQTEIERDMKLMGCTAVSQLSRENLRFR